MTENDVSISCSSQLGTLLCPLHHAVAALSSFFERVMNANRARVLERRVDTEAGVYQN